MATHESSPYVPPTGYPNSSVYGQGYAPPSNFSPSYGAHSGYPAPSFYPQTYPQPSSIPFSYAAPPVEVNPSPYESQFSAPNPLTFRSKLEELNFGQRLQYIINLNSIKRKVPDEEHDIGLNEKSKVDPKPLRDKFRTFTVDKERGCTTDFQILQTRYISAWDEDTHETVAMINDDQKSDGKESISKYDMRWRHIQSDNVDPKIDSLSLGEFQTAAMQSPGLDDEDIKLILELFRKVQPITERSFVHGKYLEPIVTRCDPKPDENGKTSGLRSAKSCVFFCLPYLSLDQFHTHCSTKNSPHLCSLHPVRSLLQTHYQLECTASRDRHQVIRKMGKSQWGLHVPQLWCLLVNKSHIITCAPGTSSKVFKDTINMQNASLLTQKTIGSRIVRFTDPSGGVYFLPVEKCQTWFGLLDTIGKEYMPISNRLTDGTRPGWQLLYEDGQHATDQNWAVVLAANKSITLNLALRWKLPELQPPPPPPPPQAPGGRPASPYSSPPSKLPVYGLPPSKVGPTSSSPSYGYLPSDGPLSMPYPPPMTITGQSYGAPPASSSKIPTQTSIPVVPYTPSDWSPPYMSKITEWKSDPAKLDAWKKKISDNLDLTIEEEKETPMAARHAFNLKWINKLEIELQELKEATERSKAQKIALIKERNDRIAKEELDSQHRKKRQDEEDKLALEAAISAALNELRDEERVFEEEQRVAQSSLEQEEAQKRQPLEIVSDSFLDKVRAQVFAEATEALRASRERLEPQKSSQNTGGLVQFTDCLGRLFSIPYSACQTWPDVKILIDQAFHRLVGVKEFVANDYFDLVVNEHIILPQCWESLVEPGWRVSMFLWRIKRVPYRPGALCEKGIVRRLFDSVSETEGSMRSEETWASRSVGSRWSTVTGSDSSMSSAYMPGIGQRYALRMRRNWRNVRTSQRMRRAMSRGRKYLYKRRRNRSVSTFYTTSRDREMDESNYSSEKETEVTSRSNSFVYSLEEDSDDSRSAASSKSRLRRRHEREVHVEEVIILGNELAELKGSDDSSSFDYSVNEESEESDVGPLTREKSRGIRIEEIADSDPEYEPNRNRVVLASEVDLDIREIQNTTRHLIPSAPNMDPTNSRNLGKHLVSMAMPQALLEVGAVNQVSKLLESAKVLSFPSNIVSVLDMSGMDNENPDSSIRAPTPEISEESPKDCIITNASISLSGPLPVNLESTQLQLSTSANFWWSRFIVYYLERIHHDPIVSNGRRAVLPDHILNGEPPLENKAKLLRQPAEIRELSSANLTLISEHYAWWENFTSGEFAPGQTPSSGSTKIKTTKEEYKYVCSNCQEEFAAESTLRMHIVEKHNSAAKVAERNGGNESNRAKAGSTNSLGERVNRQRKRASLKPRVNKPTVITIHPSPAYVEDFDEETQISGARTVAKKSVEPTRGRRHDVEIDQTEAYLNHPIPKDRIDKGKGKAVASAMTSRAIGSRKQNSGPLSVSFDENGPSSGPFEKPWVTGLGGRKSITPSTPNVSYMQFSQDSPSSDDSSSGVRASSVSLDSDSSQSYNSIQNTARDKGKRKATHIAIKSAGRNSDDDSDFSEDSFSSYNSFDESSPIINNAELYYGSSRYIRKGRHTKGTRVPRNRQSVNPSQQLQEYGSAPPTQEYYPPYTSLVPYSHDPYILHGGSYYSQGYPNLNMNLTVDTLKTAFYTPSSSKPKETLSSGGQLHVTEDAKPQQLVLHVESKGNTISQRIAALLTESITKLEEKTPQSDTKSKNERSETTNETSDQPPSLPRMNVPQIPPIFRWKVGDDTQDQGQSTLASTAQASQHSPTSSRSIPKLSQSTDNILFTVLQDSHTHLVGYISGYDEERILQRTPKLTRQDVEPLIKSAKDQSSTEESLVRDLLLEVAVHLLDSFIPTNTRADLVDVFWGSLNNIIHRANDIPRRDLIRITKWAGGYFKVIEEIQHGVLASSPRAEPQYRIPDALVPAFAHLVMLFCIFGSYADERPELRDAETRHHQRCEELLLRGKNQLILIHAGDRSEERMYKAVDTEGLAAIMFKQLVCLKGKDSETNILLAYQEYMSRLELQVLEAPSVRVFDDIQELEEELGIIETIMRQQRTVLETSLSLCRSTANSEYAFSIQALQKAIQQVQKQLHNLSELLQLAQNKKSLLSQAINVRKETNNQAILVFTVMTVVFLPLSFITSYLGMNSVDIRNAGFSQARFWELAIPLTVVVLLAVWALVKFKRGLRKGFRAIVRIGVGRVVGSLRWRRRRGRRFWQWV